MESIKSGILTGKYNKDVPGDSRMTTKGYEWLATRWEIEKKEQLPIVEKLIEYSDEKFGCNVGNLALAWCAMNKNVSTVLLGATKEAQINDNLKALDVARKMTKENMDDIDQILGNKPEAEWDAGRKLDKQIDAV